jgi:hypothetical protein
MEIVIDGLTAATSARRCAPASTPVITRPGAAQGLLRISAGNYGGKLGQVPLPPAQAAGCRHPHPRSPRAAGHEHHHTLTLRQAPAAAASICAACCPARWRRLSVRRGRTPAGGAWPQMAAAGRAASASKLSIRRLEGPMSCTSSATCALRPPRLGHGRRPHVRRRPAWATTSAAACARAPCRVRGSAGDLAGVRDGGRRADDIDW